MNRKYLTAFFAGLCIFALMGATFKTLVLDESGDCAQSVNFTGTTTLNSAAIATQAYSNDVVVSHNSDGAAHSTEFAAKQDSITASGILKGDGAGNISAASAGTDYAAPATTLAGYGITDGVLSSSISVDTGLADDSDSLIPSQHAVKYYVDNNAGVSTFTGLSDTPSVYTGEAGKYVKVNAGATALEFGTPSGSGDMTAAVYDPATIAEQLVGLTATQTLTNKTLTAPIISSISNTGTLTLPTDTDTLIGRATTDTLTNKTIDADNNTVTNIGSSEIKSEIITGLSEKASPVSADKIMLSDSEASGALKYLQISNLPSGSGSTSDTSWTGANWTSTTSSPSQRAVEEVVKDVAVRYDDRASAGTSSTNGKFVKQYVGGDTNTALLLHCDGTDASTTFTDSSVYSQSITANGNAQLDTAQYKFGTASCLLDGTGDYLSTAPINFGAADFTVDFWFRAAALSSGNHYLYGGHVTDCYSSLIIVQSGTNLVFYSASGTSSWDVASAVSISSSLVTDTWYHVAIAREGSSLRYFLDGALIGTVSTSATLYSTTDNLLIGASSGGEYFNGWIDELRVSTGVARYTEAFTPETSAYANGTKDNRLSDIGESDILQSNLLINGTFAVWQRGTTSSSISTTRTYLADRFAVKTGAGTLTTVARSTTVPTGSRSKYSLELTGKAGVTTVTIDQRIAAANTPASTVYFSAQIYNGSGAAFTPMLYVSTPSASDNWTTSTVINGSGSGESLQECADSAWTRVYWTADISGYSNIANGVEFKIEIPSGSLVASDTVRVADVVLTYGNTYIAPMVKTYAQIYDDCAWYYLVKGGSSVYELFAMGQATSTTAASVLCHLPKAMRTAPTVSLNSAANFCVSSVSGSPIPCTGLTSSSGSLTGPSLNVTVASGLVAGSAVFFAANNNTNARVYFNAEL